MKITLFSVAAILLPTIACAQPQTPGFYISASGGGDFPSALLSTENNTRITTSTGAVGLAALGWKFGNGLRAELEGSYRANTISGITTLRANGLFEPLSNVVGRASTYAAMGNMLYDIPLRSFGLSIQPYVGFGIGYALLDFDKGGGLGLGRFNLPQNNVYVGPDTVAFGSGGTFGYQVIAGASVPTQIIPGLDLTLEYRYFGTASASVPVNRVATGNNLVNGAVPAITTHNGFVEHNNVALLGLRYATSAF